MNLVCLHGFTGAPSTWDTVLSRLDGGVKAHCPALLGHDLDEGPEAPGVRFDGEVERLASGIRAHFGGEPAHLLAYSMGARLGLGLLRDHGGLFYGATLVGVHPGLPGEEERASRRRLDAERAQSLRKEGVERFAEAWGRLPLFASQATLPEHVQESQRRVRNSHRAEGLARALEVLSPAEMPDYSSDLESMPCPVTLVVGALDHKFRDVAEPMARRLPRGDVAVVPGVGHNVVLESPAAVARIVEWTAGPVRKELEMTETETVSEGSTVRPGSVRAWILASRPATLWAAVVPVLVGAACAQSQNGFLWGPTLGAFLGAIWIQIGTNFANDVFDFEKGADTGDRLGPLRAVQAGLLEPAQMRRGMVVAFGLAVLCGLYLTYVAGWPIVAIGILSILSGIAYTGGPYPLGYHGLGDLFVMLFFGFVAVPGTAFVNLGYVPEVAWWAALPVGALATNILVVNNVRDRETDRAAGKRTLVARFGRTFGVAEYVLLLFVAYAVPPLLLLQGYGSLFLLVPSPPFREPGC